ncbi:MAG TPA: hypothetical protein VLR52_02740, partial [Bacteroidales bacterium]|nr:hypothetical protein [Bacteroidales bacterium]
MKPLFNNLVKLFLISLMTVSWVSAQEKKSSNYGNIPDELVGYDKYMKAYKYHFIEPMKFY